MAVASEAFPVFGKSVNPISTRGDPLSPPSTTSPPGFSDLVTALCRWIREHSYMTSDVFWAFLTYLPTLIRYFTTYSRVPNTTVGNPYSFFGACPSYMALFGTSHLLNFKKSSFLHFYWELLAYWFFPLCCSTLQLKGFVPNNWWSKSLLMNIWFITLNKVW
jgi:hypothetical protein